MASVPGRDRTEVGFALEGSELVWKADREPVPTTDSGSTYSFRLSAQLDRSAELEVPPPRDTGH